MTALEEFRAAKDRFLAEDEHSPLTPDQKRHFRGLDYFPENPALALVVEVEEFPDKESVQMTTSTGELAIYRRFGRFRFEVDGQPAELTTYQDVEDDDFFLPFADATSGRETYGAGRYLEIERLPEGRFAVEFNFAYNPYCAYNESWSCPIPPPENRLTVPIRAGEKNLPPHRPTE